MARPVQVYLDDREFEQLEAWARKRGWTKSQAVRVAIRALTSRPWKDPVLELSGEVDDFQTDVSENFDRYLNDTYTTAGSHRTRRRPRPRR